ncbi:MAG: YraN family protein [Acidimicrobiia bacterium]|nr:YraN family protein [Acidimicrobiia bacterium]
MGVGYVPTGAVRQERKGNDVPRRQHRGARTHFGNLSPRQLGRFGETVAVRFLQDRGVRLLDRNVRIGRGEVDLLVEHQGERAVVEVKAGVAGRLRDPVYHLDAAKRSQLRRLAGSLGVFRVDYIGVEVWTGGVSVRWLPRVC